MARLTPNQLKAIGWYAEEYNLGLSLSVPPYIFFKRRDGQMLQKDISTITALWERYKKAEKNKG